MFSLATFEHQLVMYVTADDKATFAEAFDIKRVPVVSHEQALAEERSKKLTSATPTLKAPSTATKKPLANGTADGVQPATAQAQKYSAQLAAIPELKPYGAVLKSSEVIELTESETEYVVTVVKHMFKDYIVLQYEVKNTLPETVLENVSVVATPSDEDESLAEEFIMPVASLRTDEPGTIYVSFKRAAESQFVSTTFSSSLKFTTKEIDPTSGEPDAEGYEDEYEVDDFELAGSDYMLPAYAGSFDHVWEQTGANGDESSETLQLSNTKSISGSLSTSSPLPKKKHLLISPQMRPSNSQRLCRYSHSMAQTWLSRRAHTRLSYMGNRCLGARLLRWSRWRTRRNRASRPRSRSGPRRRVLRLWSLVALHRLLA